MSGLMTFLVMIPVVLVMWVVPRAVMRRYAEGWRAKRGLPPIEYSTEFGGAARSLIIATLAAVVAVVAAVKAEWNISLLGLIATPALVAWAMFDARRGRI
jgi:hypothetical protein